MTSRVSHTTIDCDNAYALSAWWKGVLDYTDVPDVPDDPNDEGDEECMIVEPASGHRLLFIATRQPCVSTSGKAPGWGERAWSTWMARPSTATISCGHALSRTSVTRES
jgi:hypothetical protein